MSFFAELKRRNVFRVGIAYAVSSWVLLQIVDLVLENIGAPTWAMQMFMLVVAAGFPIALIFAWAFELTPDGVKLESEVDRSESIAPHTGRKLNNSILVIMAVALVWFAWDKFGPQKNPEAVLPTNTAQVSSAEIPAETQTTQVERSIAVLPFVAMSSGPDDEYFADGLTEEILNSLAQLPELLITARTSSFHFKGQDIPVQEIAAALGVKHIVEGSVRRSGNRLRITAQLVRADDGFHLWSENYDSTSDDTIQVQEDIANKIADAMDVVMDDTKREAMKKAGLRNVEAFINYQKAGELFNKAHGDADQIGTLRRANVLYESVTELVPTFVPAYYEHSDVYVHILLSNAVGETMQNVTAQDITGAQANALADMTLAAEHARSTTERNDIELDLTYISGKWHRLQGSVERVLSGMDCSSSQWASTIIVNYGFADRYLARSAEVRKCNPMSPLAWVEEVYTNLWAGQKEEALKLAREANEVAPGSSLAGSLVAALIANELFEEVDQVITTYARQKEEILHLQLLKSAAMGDKKTSIDLLAALLENGEFSSDWKTHVFAWIGDRDNANRIAAEIDQQAFGSQALIQAVHSCECGAPWEIEVTPNFAADIEAAGISWPPASPLNFPLKDW